MNRAQLIDRISKLFAQAQGTTFEAERDAFEQKAYELMARHGIEEAILAGADPAKIETRRVRTITFGGPYSHAHNRIFAALARANNVEYYRVGYRVDNPVMVGFAEDMDRVEALYSVAYLHAHAEAAKQPVRFCETTMSVRRAFLLGYARGLSDKLRKAADTVRAETSSDNLPVLVERSAQVAKRYEEISEKLGLKSRPSSMAPVSASVYANGVAAGRAANVHAALSSTRGLGR